ncbi:DUF726-domain-containing protein [Dipodascopsis tothii]|uniref:DUF726-domain-containing protein n=1 Tax=Dipodascopsis tothii TaxID=44089 RepID=UPI0034CD72DD
MSAPHERPAMPAAAAAPETAPDAHAAPTAAVPEPEKAVRVLSPSPESDPENLTEAERAAQAARDADDSDGWQEMPVYASHDMYDDDGNLVALEQIESEDEEEENKRRGGATKGYTRVTVDEMDAERAAAVTEETNFLFHEDDPTDETARNPMHQMQSTKDMLTESQRIAYVGLCKLCMVDMATDLALKQGSIRASKKVALAHAAMSMWSQKIMIRLYSHMDISPEEQRMIEQLSTHGVETRDLTPMLMQNARVANPLADETADETSPETSEAPETAEPTADKAAAEHDEGSQDAQDAQDAQPATKAAEAGHAASDKAAEADSASRASSDEPLPEYSLESNPFQDTMKPGELAHKETLDIDIRWTVLCDLFLVLLADSVYDARSRTLLELVGKALQVGWVDIAKFERRVTDTLDIEDSWDETWNEQEIVDQRRKRALKKKYMYMGLATLGGGLVIGLSAGLLAPVIGAGLAAGFTTIGIAGTSGFLAGAGGAAVVTTTGVAVGARIGSKGMARRMGAVKTFEFRPLHNNNRVNLIVSISGWLSGKEDDVRLPFSTVDPVMGDFYSLHWEPDMLRSMGQTINILATEVLTQSIQQVLGSTILVALMASLQWPVVLTKLSYLLDNPWSVSLDRAWASGLILADTLINRNLGVRPVTLVGFSLGARVVYSCLVELARMKAFGLVQNVYLFGSPVVVKRDQMLLASTMVSGRFVNGYSRKDWILGYLFRATSGGLGRIAGLAPIEHIHGIENFDCTSIVEGHMSYREAMPKLLRECGWEVTSDEFTEIEDPDPDQLRGRQRELLTEFELAKRKMEKRPRKKGVFSWIKPKPKKKEWWEMYEDDREDRAPESNGYSDEPSTTSSFYADVAGPSTVADAAAVPADPTDPAILFDVEAIRREITQAKKSPTASGFAEAPPPVIAPPPIETLDTSFASEAGEPVLVDHSPQSIARSLSTVSLEPSSASSLAHSSFGSAPESPFAAPTQFPALPETDEPPSPPAARRPTYADFDNVWDDSKDVHMTFE